MSPCSAGETTRDQSFQVTASLKQRDRDIVVADRDSVFEIEFFAQPQSALEPLRAFLRIAHSQAKVTNLSKREWNFHEGIESLLESIGLGWFGAVSRNERLHEVLVEIFQSIARRFS
jgi:hypothetical protein